MTPEKNDTTSRLTIDVYLNNAGLLDAMANEVREGLSSTPRQIPPKYFYDACGSQLFEEITKLSEYYPTRAEHALLLKVAPAVIERTLPSQIVELGSGSSTKTRVLLDAARAAGSLEEYVAFDVSKAIIEEAAVGLTRDYPTVRIRGVVGDFNHHLRHIPDPAGARLVLFLGGTIGNLHKQERTEFLSGVRDLLGPSDHLLLGVDIVKDITALEAAYDDSLGVTAAFNRNMLAVINNGLQGNFLPDAFEHRAFFNAKESRIEMHLVPRVPQHVNIADIDLDFIIAPPETIWTESSYKFTEASIDEMLESAGLRLDKLFVHQVPNEEFGLALASAAD